MRVELEEFIECFSQNIGKINAEMIVQEAVRRVGFSLQTDYSKDEAIKILEHLQQRPGFVSIVAGVLMSRTIVRFH